MESRPLVEIPIGQECLGVHAKQIQPTESNCVKLCPSSRRLDSKKNCWAVELIKIKQYFIFENKQNIGNIIYLRDRLYELRSTKRYFVVLLRLRYRAKDLSCETKLISSTLKVRCPK